MDGSVAALSAGARRAGPEHGQKILHKKSPAAVDGLLDFDRNGNRELEKRRQLLSTTSAITVLEAGA
jgi:hypothetical protein